MNQNPISNLHSEIILRVSDTVTYIEGKLDKNVYQGLKKNLGYQDNKAMWKAPQRKNGKPNLNWDGWRSTVCYNKKYCRCHIKKEGTHFPTGLISLARDFFKRENVPYQLIDDRVQVSRDSSYSMSPDFELRDYQLDAIQKAVKQQRGIIKAATGSGKTAIASGMIAELGVKPFIFYVTSIDLLKQAKSELEKFILKDGKPIEVGIIGGGICNIKDINIMTVQTAVRSLGKKYIKSNDEDGSGDTGKYDKSDKELIANVIRNSQGIVCDECLIGSTKIHTDKGIVSISEVSTLDCKYVLSYDGNNVIWKKIINFIPQAEKDTISITLSSQEEITCTKNHPLMTNNGWKKSGEIKEGDKILTCDQELILKLNIKDYWRALPFVNAAAEKKSSRDAQALTDLSSGEIEDIENMFTDMIRGLTTGIYEHLILKNKQFSEHCLETPSYLTHPNEAKTLEYNAIMEGAKKSGFSTSQTFCLTSLQEFQKEIMEDSEAATSVCHHLAIQHLLNFIKSHILMVKRKLINNGLMQSGISDSHGGCAMMDQVERIISDYTLKDILTQKLISSIVGLSINMEKQASINQNHHILSSDCENLLWNLFYHVFINMFPNVCDTSLKTVVSVKPSKIEKVYDITVEDTHCFFANGVLVHNCQHWAAKTCQIIADHSLSARYRYALSATPWRDEGDDMLIDACFGKSIIDINASFLIKKGILIQPSIYFVHMPRLDIEGSYQTVYKEGIVENIERNTMIANLADQMVKNGRQTLILVKHIDHGNTLESMIPNSFFINGSHSGKQREEWIQKMRDKEAKVTIATSIFDEGVDVKPLDGLILAGSGKSQTRALQRIGRVIRAYKDPVTGIDKKDAFIVDFVDNTRYLRSHSDKRRSIYSTEPEFIIKDYR